MNTETTPFATVEEALEDIASGRMVVVVDDEDRENEGDLIMAAELVQTSANAPKPGKKFAICAHRERRAELGGQALVCASTARPGTPVNLEVDILAKYVEKLVRT